MLAGGDEDLGTGQLVAAVAVLDRPRFDQAQIGAAVGLGETHGAGPGAVHQFRQIGAFLLVRAVGVDGVIGAHAQARINAKGEVARADHFLHRIGDGVGRILAAELGIAGEPGPAALGKFGISLLEALGRSHHAVFIMAAFLVTRTIQRKQDRFAKLARLLQDGLHQIG